MVQTYQVGEIVEARVPEPGAPVRWRRGYIVSFAPYRGAEGYYVNWCDGITESWQSRGGWQCMRTIRPLAEVPEPLTDPFADEPSDDPPEGAHVEHCTVTMEELDRVFAGD